MQKVGVTLAKLPHFQNRGAALAPQGSGLGLIYNSSSRTLKTWRNLLLNTESVTICSLMTAVVYCRFWRRDTGRLTSCVCVLRDLCASRRLQLNASKTELIWFDTRTSLRLLSSADRAI